MSIVRLRKTTIIGMTHDRCEVLEALQTLGCMHLIPLQDKPQTLEEQQTGPSNDTAKALRYLRESPVRRRQVPYEEGFDIQEVTRWVLLNQDNRRKIMDLRDELKQRIHDLEPWGDFNFTTLEELCHQRLWFYTLPRGKLKSLQDLDLPWEVVHQDPSTAWVVVISPDEPPHDALPVARTHTGSRSLSEVRKELEAVEIELDEVEAERQSLTRWITLIIKHMARAEDMAELDFALNRAAQGETCFAIQGWVPYDRVDDVMAFGDAHELAIIFEDPAPDDEPPTLLRAPQRTAAGEDLVGFYQMPSYRGWDPSRILFFSFALFFAMILSDAGYAALLGLILAGFWRKMGRSENGRRWRNLLATIVSGSLVWGVMVGSYFGMVPPPAHVLSHLQVLDLNDFDTMMKLSVSIGAIHIAMANIQMVMLWWGDRRAGVHLGWIVVLIGGLGLWLGMSAGMPHAREVGGGLLVAGLVAVFFFSGRAPVNSFRGLVLRVLQGLQALTNFTKIFGDVLSYLRLFALGLASASLALTFNDLARQVSESSEGLGLLAALLILLVGHALNLALAMISGVVHGLRLNYIEFYNWGLSGEGYPFRAFRKKELNE